MGCGTSQSAAVGVSAVPKRANGKAIRTVNFASSPQIIPVSPPNPNIDCDENDEHAAPLSLKEYHRSEAYRKLLEERLRDWDDRLIAAAERLRTNPSAATAGADFHKIVELASRMDEAHLDLFCFFKTGGGLTGVFLERHRACGLLRSKY